jgi:hypothetical protein
LYIRPLTNLVSFFYNSSDGNPGKAVTALESEDMGEICQLTGKCPVIAIMTSDVIDIIDNLKIDAVERCRRRILQAAEKKGGCAKRAKNDTREYGITSVIKRRHGL